MPLMSDQSGLGVQRNEVKIDHIGLPLEEFMRMKNDQGKEK